MFQKLTKATNVFIFAGGVQGYIQLENGELVTFASHSSRTVTSKAKLDLCFNPEVSPAYKELAGKALIDYRKGNMQEDYKSAV